MASFINTNMASLNTQRNLSASQAALSTSIQRLSSGMRVNSAKDDAAGMAIASRMDSQIRGQTVAMRNANDAISFSQTAEGALSKIGDNLQRMRELAVQAANGTNGLSDRQSLNTEFTQLQDEINRVRNNTKFNGVSVLDGSAVKFQVGSGTTDQDTIQIQGTNLTDAASSTSSALARAAKVVDTADVVSGSSTTNAAYTHHAAVAAVAATGSTAAVAAVAAYDDVNAKTGTDGSGIDILSADNATSALDAIDAALKEVNTESIKHGATQNRFQAVIATLQVSSENQTAARSRIMDTDFASETATMARGQILQQAGMAMLAQANQLPNGVMALLR